MMVDQAPTAQPASTDTRKMTFDEFLHLPDDLYAELVDGDVIEFVPPSIKHNDIAAFLFYLLLTYVGYRPVGRVFHAPIALKLPGEIHGREPDLLFVAEVHSEQIKNNYIESPVDAVFEIVSPESIERDRNDKFNEYQATQIPEYWLISSSTARALISSKHSGEI